MTAPAGSLTAAIESGLPRTGVTGLSGGVQRLMTAYRSGEVPASPVLATRADAAAYAAYRMPATAAAVTLAARELARAVPGFAPARLLDVGAGTGGASWAIATELASIGAVTLLEQSAEAIRLGRAILAAAPSAALRQATWQSWRLPAEARALTALPGADLTVCSYVLGELTMAQQAELTRLAMGSAPVLLAVEPGTPAGQARILSARAQLLQAGWRIAAPCPHEQECPLAAAADWCHFAARLPRSAVHRQAKGAELAYEDEKFSYVAAVAPDQAAPRPPAMRVVRRPQQRKGLVLLEVCAADGTSRRALVSKSMGESYKAARKAAWGDALDEPG